jgi:Na+/proline symporter
VTELPLVQRPWIAAVAAAYLLAVLAVGVWAARRTRTGKDFFIAGQGIGLLVTGLATMSAAFSGFVFLGGPGLTYRYGLASLWIVLPVSFTGGLLCWVLGGRLRRLAAIREIYTVPDAIACRFESRPAAGLAAVAIVLGTVAYLGLQVLALGLLLRSVLDVPAVTLLGRTFDASELAVAVALGVLLLYAVLGGMIAGVYTDVLQGGLMLVTAVAVFAQALRVTGGWGGLTRTIAEAESLGPAFLEPLGGMGAPAAFGFLFVFGVGVLGQPHMLHKFYMIDDPRKLRWMPLVLGSGQAVCLLIWVGIGLAVPALVARGALVPPARPDDATPAFLLHHAPEVLAGLALAGVLAALMSTADSFLNIGSAALVRDLPRAFGRRLRNEVAWGRAAVVAIAVVATVFAYTADDLIALVGTFAFGTFAAALAPALAVGLCWERVTARAATASIATGIVLNAGLEFLAKQSWIDWLPRPPIPPGAPASALALAASFVVLLAVSWWTRPAPLAADVRAVVDG